MIPGVPFAIMVAGPNGSGKTTLVNALRGAEVDFGEYVNPDDIAATLAGDYGLRVRQAQQIAEQRRQACIADRRSFTYETVMSHPSKIELLQKAKSSGFHTKVYFVATERPTINVERVRLRVALKGHDVPIDKILARYHRTLSLLPQALAISDETLLFDNSQTVALGGSGLRLVARRLNGVTGPVTTLFSDDVPNWLRQVLAAET